MSFIFEDKKLLAELLGSFTKTAQDALINDQKNIARKLVNKLERQYSNVPEPLNISSGTSSAQLGVPDLQSLDKLIQFLNNNKIKIDNQIIAYSDKEYQNLSEEEKDKLSTISAKMSRDAGSRKWNESDFYVNLPLLVQYIKYLQEKASNMEQSGNVQGQVLRVMVGKLIDSVNAISPNLGLTRSKQKSTPENPNVLPDDAVLDDFNTKTFDAKNPFADRGTNQIKLYAKDLKNREALNAWLLGDDGSEASIINYDANGQRTSMLFSDEKANPCIMINVLYLRANRWLQLSKSEQDTKKYTYYVNKIKELGPSYSDPNGSACTIGGSPSKSEITALVPGKDDASGSSSGSGLTASNVAEVMGDLPFSIRDVDFGRIRRFFAAVQKIIGNNQAVSQSVMSRIHNAEQYMQQFTALTGNSDVIVPLGQTPVQFARLLSNQENPGKQFFPALELLDRVIDATRGVVEAFFSAYSNQLKEHYPTYISYILGQIGRNPDDPSIYSRNATALENLRTAGKVT